MKDLITYSENLIKQEEENALIEQAKVNPERFKPIYEKYFEKIFRFLHKRHINLEDAEELTSQTFFKALTKLNRYKNKGLPFSSWLYKIALNESNMFFRAQRKKQIIMLDEDVLELLSEEIKLPSIDEDFKIVEKAFDRLKKNELSLLQLRFYENLSFREIGDILGISDNNAKVKCYRILDKIRIAIDKS